MSASLLACPSNLLYSDPEILDGGSVNMAQFKPLAESYTAGTNLNVRIESLTEYIDLKKSFITFDITATGITSIGTLGLVGGAGCIQSLTESIGGSSLPQIANVPLLYHADFKTDSVYRKTMLAETNYFGVSSTSFATTGTTTLSVAVPMCGHLKTINNLIPLPDIPGGIEYQFGLASANKVFITAGCPTTYTVTNFAINAHLTRPSDNYLKQHQAALASGKTIRLPVECAMINTFSVSSSLSQTHRFNCGFKDSVNSLLLDVRTVSGDPFAATNSELKKKLTSCSFMVGTTRYPKNHDIYIKDKPNSVWHMMAMSSCEDQITNFSGFNAASGTGDDGFYLQNFKATPADFSGIPVENGSVELNTTWSGSAAAATDCNLVLFYDGVLSISNSAVSLAV